MANAIKIVADLGPPQSGGEHLHKWRGWKVFTAEPIASTTTVDSIVDIGASILGLSIAEYQFFGLWIQLASAGVPSVDVKILQSWDDVAADYVLPDLNSVIKTGLADTNPHVYAVSPTPLPLLRVRLVGTGANPADVTATAILWAQG